MSRDAILLRYTPYLVCPDPSNTGEREKALPNTRFVMLFDSGESGSGAQREVIKEERGCRGGGKRGV